MPPRRRDTRRNRDGERFSRASVSPPARWRSHSSSPARRRRRRSSHPTLGQSDRELGQRRTSCCRELDRIPGRCTLPDQKACTIEQPAGRDWRHFHQVTLPWIGAIAILGMLAAARRVLPDPRHGADRIGPVRPHHRALQLRSSGFVHWMTATCFIILALVGPQHHLRQAAAAAADRARRRSPPSRSGANTPTTI